ncbi:hypothetical protein N0V90_011828 [Kalmusia sp. IMI 367209]|nr:hypothetical protein N0V90_011828 [Kalmusia sp. IMI 367209]
MPPSDKVHIAALQDSDIPTAFSMMSQSFGHDAPFINAYFISHDTPAGQAQGAKRLLAWKQSAPESTFLKAVLTQDGEEIIIGLAIWTHMVEAPPQTLEATEGADEVKEYWPDEQDREWMKILWSEYVKPRTEAVKSAGEKGVYVLELLAVHPSYQRLGAGAALVKWGVAAADEKGLGAVIESTDAGRLLYEKCGLKCEIEQMEFNVGEGFKGKKTPKLSFMVREAQRAN